MTTYKFETTISIEAANEQEALDIYDALSETLGVKDIYCHAWGDGTSQY